MLKTLQTLMMASAVVALSACGGGGGGGGGGESSSTSSPPPVSAIGTVSVTVNKGAVRSPTESADLTITIANPNSTAVINGALTVALPAGPKSTSSFAVGAPCTSTTFSVGNSGFVLTGITVPAGATCTNIITLTPSTVTPSFTFSSSMTNLTTVHQTGVSNSLSIL